MEFSFYSVIMDFFWASVVLFGAKIIREHVKVFQNYFIPDRKSVV